MDNVRQRLIEKVDEYKEKIIYLSTKIHEYSELSFQEVKSSQLLADTLECYGFSVQRGIGSLNTAFKAVYKGKKNYPAVAFLAEYDALPGVGHGCGHNLIAASSVFAAIALSQVIREPEGNIVVMGTPAEETGGGKIILIDEGAFDDINYSIMAHPSSINQVGRGGRAITSIHIEFFGKSAHSSIPEKGINALKAVINTFIGIDQITQSFPEGISTNGIIIEGGKSDNTIPEYSKCQFSIRAKKRDDLLLVLEKIKEVIKSSEILTGARAEIYIEPIYAERYPNMTMELKYKEYMEQLGEEVNVADPTGKYGSSDIGNISLKMPIIHSYFKIMEEPINSHSKDFSEMAVKEAAFNGMIKSTKALAMLGANLLTDKYFRAKVDDEFNGVNKSSEK
jgi:amidohydrolase